MLNKQTGAKARFVYDDWLERSPENPTATVTLHEASSDTAKVCGMKGMGISQRVTEWHVVLCPGAGGVIGLGRRGAEGGEKEELLGREACM